ncbi:MAG: CHAT domain-containing protein [Muribaculaceae bacterium]|nr:CHAT domain-containing protein [Muribaculaceae bacterium]
MQKTGLNYPLAFLTVITLAFSSVATILSPEEKEQRMLNYNAKVRTGVEMLWTNGQLPPQIAECNDSLRHYLYADTVSISLPLQVISRLTVETFNLATQSDNTDYHQIVVALNSCKNAPAFYDSFFLASCIGLGKHNLEENDDRQAIAAFSLAMKCVDHEKNAGRFDSFRQYLRLQMGYASSRIGDFDEAVKWQSEYAEGVKTISGETSDEYISSLTMLAGYEKSAGKTSDAEVHFRQICDALKSSGRESGDEYANALFSLAEIAHDEKIYHELLGIVDERNEIFPDVMAAAAHCYHDKGDYAGVLGCMDRVLTMAKESKIDIRSLSVFISYLDFHYVKSEYADRFLDAIKHLCDYNDMTDCAALATAYAKCGDFGNAVKMASRVKRMADRALENKDESIALTFSSVVQMFISLSDFDNALKYHKVSLPYVTDAFDKIAPAIIEDNIKLLASYHAMAGDINSAKDIIEDLLTRPNLTDSRKVELLMEMAAILHGAGDYESADLYCRETLSFPLDDKKLWEVLNLRASALISWIDSSYDRESDDFEAKLESLRMVIGETETLARKSDIVDFDRQVYLKLHAATLNFLSGDNAEMIKAADEAEAIINNGTDNASLRDTYLSALAMYHVKSGDYSKAIKLSSLKTPGSDIEAIYNLQIQAEANLRLGDKAVAQKKYGELAERILGAVSRSFSMLTEREKESYWRMFERQIADAGRFADPEDENSPFGGLVYNLALNSKGLLLNSMKSFSDVIEQSDNAEVAELYSIWKNKRRARSENLLMTTYERELIDKEISRLQLTLARLVPESNNLNSDMRYDWSEIRDCLGKNDVAIEFLEFQDIDYSRSYAAALLTPGLKNPIIVNLGAVEKIERGISDFFKASGLWGRLLPYMSPEGKVYFSAVGKLNCLPIESLLLDDGHPVERAYSVYRLSSTREIVAAKTEKGSGVALFGGIDYGNRRDVAQRVHRGQSYSLPFLPGTEREIDIVGGLLADHGHDMSGVERYAGLEGSETNFRNLSGRDIGIVHIATHGYYLSSHGKSLSRLPLSARSFYTKVDSSENAMVNSGLFLANANRKNDSDSSSDDGIITALELSELDFSKVDMMVLSACETGIGTLTGDGVFGLQRGLKLSGVKSIMMTLDKIDDEIACDMMTEFYAGLLAGQTKKVAFDAAKEKVRQKYPSGRSWSSFILLDALD